MEYCKIDITIIPLQEWFSDLLMSQLTENSYESFVSTEQGFEAYIPSGLFSEENLKAILENTIPGFKVSYKAEILPEKNWNEEWEKNYFQPRVIKDTCLIRAPFHTSYHECPIEIIIEPNMAFGTGNHETTTLMVESILGNQVKGKKVLDMGCGTGILAILASKLGAKEITAIDIDKWAYEGTIENSKLNSCSNIKPIMGDASLLGTNTYDLIFANIHKNVLLNDMQTYYHSLNPGGTIFLSGFYSQDIPDIKKCAESMGLTDAGYKIANDWVAYSFIK